MKDRFQVNFCQVKVGDPLEDSKTLGDGFPRILGEPGPMNDRTEPKSSCKPMSVWMRNKHLLC